MQLDQVLVRGEELDRTPLAWLGERAAANSSKAILAELKKLDFMRELGVAEWDLSTILDPSVSDGQLRQTIYRHVPADKLLTAVARMRSVGASTRR